MMHKRIFCLIFLLCLFNLNYIYASDYENHWAKEYIESAINQHLASGISEEKFEPDRNITRAEFISLLTRFKKISSDSIFTSFNDISSDSWYFPIVVAAEENNIINGYEDGGFHPDNPVTRQDAVTFICRAYNLDPPFNINFMSFSDSSDISDYAKNYVYFAIENKILIGYENNSLKPKNYITRAEALIILDKFSKLSDTFEQIPEFLEDYPKISPRGAINNITLELKTNVPCTIYYKAVKKDTSISYLLPKKEEINNFLAYIPDSEKTVTSNIVLDSYNENYNIFLIAVADHGASSKIQRIKDVKALAYSDGDGSIENPYMIYDENQLNYIRYCQNKHFKLANDIVLTKEWIPINASAGYFGSIDGNGYTISNLNIKNNDTNSGFFSVITNGIIKNLTISGDIKSKNNVGLFAGKSEGTIISNCCASGFVKSSANNAGGITGINNGIIENCLSAVYSVEAITNAGGISGSNSGKITNSLSAVHSVLSDMYAGGISGINNSGKIKNCVSANLNVIDFFAYNSGRITTNKENGLTENNYGYNHMKTNAADMLPNADSINGTDISWNEIISESFYMKTLEWDFKNEWIFPDNKSNTFILPFPRIFKDIKLTDGITPYSPIKISDADMLKNINPEFHYLLVNDIKYNNTWKIPEEDYEFNGSFDGNGFTIYGVTIPYSDNIKSYSMFGTISEGTVRNLNLNKLKIEGIDSVSAIAQTNYGNIENCKVSGTITADQISSSVSCGGIVSINYGNIENCEADINFTIRGNSSTIGGISSHNEGFINNTSYSGNIDVNTKGLNSSTSAGGITGFNNEGLIYNSFTKTDFNINAYTNYSGGICGILNSGEIFKTSSKGNIKTISQDTAVSTSYTGGICGLSASGLIVNSFSGVNINTKSTVNYSGGICGFNSSANIQSTYSINTISQTGGSFMPSEMSAYAGGIAGYNETGFLSDNVAVNPWILSNGYSKRICNCTETDFLSNNYAYKNIIKNIEEVNDKQNGISLTLNEIKNTDFFFTPLYKGGKLGWSSNKYDGENGIWTAPKTYNNIYKFPILYEVKNQTEFITPSELK